MKIAIFSDLHDDGGNLKIFLDFCQREGIQKIVFCGDLASGESLDNLATNFDGQIFMVGGNADLFDGKVTKKYGNVIFSERTLTFKLEKLQILAIHKPKDLKEFLETSNQCFDFAFHGHTHRPGISRRGKTIIANPGSLNGPRYQASFAMLDSVTRTLELKILANIKNP